jgi:putative toxin-antitoxin system antitoxin component (TIGR02293 family)
MVSNAKPESSFNRIQDLLGIASDRQQQIEPSQMIAAGIPARAIVRIKQVTGLSEQQMAEVVGISRRTLSRRIQQATTDSSTRLTAAQSDRLYRLARIVARAVEVFGDESEAKQWLNEPKLALNGRSPLEVVSTEPGVEQVDIMLGRIEHGIFA